MTTPRSPLQTFHHHAFAVALLSLVGNTTSTALAASEGTDPGAFSSAAALGVVRTGASANVVSIDFDVPRNGPLCISVERGDELEFVWEEYHNLHQLFDEDSFRGCDFSGSKALALEGKPMPEGYRIGAAATVPGEGNTRYFSCSKICASNGHKVRVCAGGSFGETNECLGEVAGCTPDRTLDLRRLASAGEVAEAAMPRTYLASGTVCRPKNGDGYSIATRVDTPESCQEKCEADAPRCGAWEFENYDLDNRECELHEADIISYEETRATGDCQLGGDYRCCWIATDVVEAQKLGKPVDSISDSIPDSNSSSTNPSGEASSSRLGGPAFAVVSTATMMALLSGILDCFVW